MQQRFAAKIVEDAEMRWGLGCCGSESSGIQVCLEYNHTAPVSSGRNRLKQGLFFHYYRHHVNCYELTNTSPLTPYGRFSK